MKKITIIFTSLVLLFIFACNQADKNFSDNTETIGKYEYAKEEEINYDMLDDDIPQDVRTTDETEPVGGTSSTLTDDEIKKIGKKIIKNADISIEVEDYKDFIKRTKDSLNNFDCYISSEEESKTSYAIYNTLVIRVKSSQFDSLLAAILSGDDLNITSKSIYVNDITEQYVDIYQRLKARKLARDQYTEIMKKARTVNEILNVMSYINNIQEQIDAAEGRIKYLDDQVNYSTITITITQNIDENVIKDNFWKKIINALKAGWQGLLYIILAIFYLWPVWILTGIIIFVVRRRKKNKAKINKND